MAVNQTTTSDDLKALIKTPDQSDIYLWFDMVTE